MVPFDATAWGERHLAVEWLVAVGGDRIAHTVERAEGVTAVKGALIDEDDRLVVGLRSAVPAGAACCWWARCPASPHCGRAAGRRRPRHPPRTRSGMPKAPGAAEGTSRTVHSGG
ncbi:hypothetical protein [Streptomyces sp. NRRL S-378]|uniref:hypothetical protein n=1 Tax=Streptomyces sp. NRRL S-378 TaxID=1463904 RepID=UPI0004CBE5D7|nr:hypothetical protein [Streptomyces sp. NRRL S-378]